MKDFIIDVIMLECVKDDVKMVMDSLKVESSKSRVDVSYKIMSEVIVSLVFTSLAQSSRVISFSYIANIII